MTVYKCSELPNKEFPTKEGMFKALKKNKDLLIDSKKAASKHSDSIKLGVDNKLDTVKGIDVSENETVAVINTTFYKDSHDDVHIDGLWDKSLSEQIGKVYYVTDHEISINSIIIPKEDLTMSVESVSWRDLGADYDGETQALMFKFDNADIMNDSAKKIITKGKSSENSIRMQYVKLDLAIDDDGDDFKEEKAVWDKYINKIANKSETIQNGYFWAVEEAKIYKEGSMVIAGSNDITPMIYSNKDIEAVEDTSKNEPSDDTRSKFSINNFI